MEYFTKNRLVIKNISTLVNINDTMTKSFPTNEFQSLRIQMGLKPIPMLNSCVSYIAYALWGSVTL